MLLGTITVLNPIGLAFDMDERSYLDYQRLVREKEVTGIGSALSMRVANESGFPREGILVGFGDRIDEKSGTIRARARLANPDGLLLPGMFARVRVKFGRPRPVVEVPSTALGHRGNKEYVLVVNDRNQVERRTVQRVMGQGAGFPPMNLDDPKVFIKEGITPEDWVVTDAQGLQPGDQVEVRRIKKSAESDPAKK